MARSTISVLVGVAVLAVAFFSSATHPDEIDVRPVAGIATGEVRTFVLQAETKPALSSPEPYVRADYAPSGWDDTDGDCQSDRHEVLIDESLIAVTLTADRCRVESGLWIDRFDGRRYTKASDVTIDHLVALSAAHRAGAWRWDLESKRRFAHDLGFEGALGVVGSATNQAKADKSPAQWRPPLRSAWCDYAIDWIRVKHRWQLMFADDEATALHEMLDTCEAFERVAVSLAFPTPAAPAPPAPPPTPVVVSSGTAMVVIGKCDALSEVVTLENRGQVAASLDHWILHDRDKNHILHLDGLQIDPGGRLRIATGEQPLPDHDLIFWKHENVWNNSGDTATLIAPNSAMSSVHSC